MFAGTRSVVSGSCDWTWHYSPTCRTVFFQPNPVQPDTTLRTTWHCGNPTKHNSEMSQTYLCSLNALQCINWIFSAFLSHMMCNVNVVCSHSHTAEQYSDAEWDKIWVKVCWSVLTHTLLIRTLNRQTYVSSDLLINMKLWNLWTVTQQVINFEWEWEKAADLSDWNSDMSEQSISDI